MTRLKGKSALITGGSRGIGRAICLRLAEEGAAVAVNYVSSEKAASEVVAAIEERGGKAVALQADVRDEDAVAAMVQKAIEELEKVDLLVNNAGVMHPAKDHQPFWETPTSRWDDILAIDLRGPFLCAKYVARHLIDRGARGSIVNLTSFIGPVMGMPLAGIEYHAAKAGVAGITLDMAAELGPHGITVNAIAPGSVPTDMSSHLRDPEVAEKRAQSIPVRRLGTPEDIAATAAFLLSEEASFITGQLLVADGGFTRLVT